MTEYPTYSNDTLLPGHAVSIVPPGTWVERAATVSQKNFVSHGLLWNPAEVVGLVRAAEESREESAALWVLVIVSGILKLRVDEWEAVVDHTVNPSGWLGGLIPGLPYYLKKVNDWHENERGRLTNEPSNVRIGLALDSTRLKLQINGTTH